MISWIFLVLALYTIIRNLQPKGNGLDEETLRLHLELRAKRIEEERIRLERELEQLRLLNQSGWAWGDLLVPALQQWQLWAFAGLLVLLAAWFIWRKRSCGEEEKEKEKEAEEEDHTEEYDLNWLLEGRIQWPVQDLQTGCERTMALMDNFLTLLRREGGTFSPVLQRAIGVGSAFEGWTGKEKDIVYRVLLPLTPPRGHTFHLELNTARQRPSRNFRVRVGLVCSCPREQQGANMLCFLHHPDEIRRRTGQPILLDTLCTGFYLDAQKTALWFSQLLRDLWQHLPQSHSWHLELLPPRRSCKLRLTNAEENLHVKVRFGVQRRASDIFVSSQPRGSGTPRTTWSETYGVAEMKFFRHMARQVPQDSSHLKCLQLMACVPERKHFATFSLKYIWKTIVMRLLNTVPLSRWHSREFLFQLSDILEHLRLSLEEKRLDHFIVGNQRLPEEIRLPRDIRMAEPPNIFHGLAQDPAAHSEAMEAYLDLRRRLARVLAYGHC